MLQGGVYTRSSPQINKSINIMHKSYSDTLHPHISDVIANQGDGYRPSFMKNFFVLWLYKLVIYPSEFILNRTFIDQNVFPFFVVVSFYSSTPMSVQMLLDQKRYTGQNLRAIIHTARQTDNHTIYPLRKLVEYLAQLLIFVCLFKSTLTLLPRLFSNPQVPVLPPPHTHRLTGPPPLAPEKQGQTHLLLPQLKWLFTNCHCF